MPADESAPIEFWFDLSSPYAYFASLRIDDIAAGHGRSVIWRPFLLGLMFRVTGNAPLTEQPLKGDYARRDWERLARMDGVPFVMRPDFPLRTQVPARMILATRETSGESSAGDLAKALLASLFADGLDISDPAIAAHVGARVGLDPAELTDAAGDDAWRSALRRQCDEAGSRGIFGSPWIVVDGEPFWGADRLPMVERWLSIA